MIVKCNQYSPVFIFRFGIFNPAVVYDHLGEIFSALILASFNFCFFLYVKLRISN